MFVKSKKYQYLYKRNIIVVCVIFLIVLHITNVINSNIFSIRSKYIIPFALTLYCYLEYLSIQWNLMRGQNLLRYAGRNAPVVISNKNMNELSLNRKIVVQLRNIMIMLGC